MWPKGFFWVVSELHILSGWDLGWIWKPSCLVQGQEISFHREGLIWLKMEGEVRVLSVLNPILSLCHITTPCHKSCPIITPQIPLRIYSEHLCISFCWTSSVKPLQSAQAIARSVKPIFIAQPAMGLSRSDSSSCLQLCCLRRVAESDSPFAARLYLVFRLLWFKRKMKSLLEK